MRLATIREPELSVCCLNSAIIQELTVISLQDSMNRSAILSSQSAALQEQLMLAGDREREMKAKESQLADKVKSLEAKVHMMTDVKENWTAIKKESEDKDARLQEAERQLAQFVAARNLEEEQGHQAVVDEFMKRLSDKEKEVDAAQAQVCRRAPGFDFCPSL